MSLRFFIMYNLPPNLFFFPAVTESLNIELKELNLNTGSTIYQTDNFRQMHRHDEPQFSHCKMEPVRSIARS